VREDDSGDDEDDELPCVIRGQSERNSMSLYLKRLAKFIKKLIPQTR